MLGEWPVWKQLVAALVVLACMWGGTADAGMRGGLAFAVAAGVVLQTIAWATRQPQRKETPPEG